MYVVYLSCDFVTKMIIKKIWKSILISGLWFGIVQFLNRNIQACISQAKCEFITNGNICLKLINIVLHKISMS